eukprot:scaffold90852_cov63-Phaeocystis_antarctica.AAC.2
MRHASCLWRGRTHPSRDGRSAPRDGESTGSSTACRLYGFTLLSVFRLRREQPTELSLAPFRSTYVLLPLRFSLFKCSAICSLTRGCRARLLRRELAHLLPPPWTASLRACGSDVCASPGCARSLALSPATWSSHTLEREGMQEKGRPIIL